MDQWSLQDAKNKFSQVVDQALVRQRPQVITRRGKCTAVLLSYDRYLELSAGSKSLLAGLLPDEPVDFELDVTRDRNDLGRDIAL